MIFWGRLVATILSVINKALGIARDERLRKDGAREQREADRKGADQRIAAGFAAADRARSERVPDDAFRD